MRDLRTFIVRNLGDIWLSIKPIVPDKTIQVA
jgi:hypothetical protein